MTILLPGFDPWLHDRLEDCARRAGEDVEGYVARAVAVQMVADQRREGAASVQELTGRLAESGFAAEILNSGLDAALADPDRLRALRTTGLLNSPPDRGFDRLARTAADALGAPCAAIALVDSDREFVTGAVGASDAAVHLREIPIERSVNKYVVADAGPVTLQDARRDPVFANHPAVLDGLTSYLGVPLADGKGNVIGALSVSDTKVRLWGAGHLQVLSDLAQVAGERIFAVATTFGR